jgi:hypothetical protein
MAQETKVIENTCLIPTFERNRYFFGKPMTVSDFAAEQQYIIGKSRLQNRLINGSGIICGMVPSAAKITGDKLTIYLTEGVALDCCGNLIVVNKSDTVEVQAQGTPGEGPHYLYLRFSECVRQPIMASANVSGCEEVCCYNRIRETFEVFLSNQAPNAGSVSFTGSVKTVGNLGITGARVKALRKIDSAPNGIVQSETLTDATGKFSLEVPGAGIAFDVVASATGFSALRKDGVMVPLHQTEADLGDFELPAKLGSAPAEVCNDLTQDYFDGHSSNCLRCDDPKVFLAIATFTGGVVTIDTTSSDARRDRSVVYTNPMLHELWCDHVSDFNNPHRTTAAQVKALQNVNGVGNADDKAEVVPRIDIVSNGTIQIEPAGSSASANKITIKGPAAATQTPKPVSGLPQIGTAVNSFALEDHVHTIDDNVVVRKHLNDDVFGNLVFSSDSSIKVGTKPHVTGIGDRQIDITTELPPKPSDQMPSKVSLNPSIGNSTRYALADHVHGLAEDVVGNKNLTQEVINTLINAEDATITITRDPTKKQITLKTNPATDVSSVGPVKSPGTSLRFAREDHVHNLQINERAPDTNGVFKLTAEGNVEINGGSASNQLIIKVPPSQTARPSRVTTGRVRFEEIKIHETRPSPPIQHHLDAGNFAIVLGVETKEGLVIGDLSSFSQQNPLLEARYTPGSDSFRIELRDERAPTENIPVSYTVRWWAIPSTDEIELVVSSPQQPPPPA